MQDSTTFVLFSPPPPDLGQWKLLDRLQYVPTTPPSPTSTIDPARLYDNSTSDDLSCQFGPPPIPLEASSLNLSSRRRVFPHPTCHPRVQLPPPPPRITSSSSSSWAPRISSVYQIKMTVARLAAYRLVQPRLPLCPTRAELKEIHDIVHYVRGFARNEEAFELVQDEQQQEEEEEGGAEALLSCSERKKERERRIQILTLFRVLTEFHPTLRSRVPTEGELRLVMTMVKEAVEDDEKSFEEVFDPLAFRSSVGGERKKKRGTRLYEFDGEYKEGQEEEEGRRSRKSLRLSGTRTKQQAEEKPRRKSLRAQVLSRSLLLEGGTSHKSSLIDWD